MKKNNIFYVCAAAALVFASCQKEARLSEGTNPETPTAEMDVITAKTADTKVTTLDGVNVLWDKGDKIQLFTRTWNEGTSKYDAAWCDYTTTLDAPSATASFVRDEANTNTVDNTSGKYLAINHKGATVVTQSRDYYAQIALNKEQVAKNGGDFVSTLLYAASENSEFTFSHATAYLKFTVDNNTTPFKKLTVTPVNDSEYVVSRIQITFSGDVTCEPIPLNSSSKPYSQSSKTVSVTTDDEAAFAPGTYHIAINTGTYADGLKLTFSNGSEDVVVTTPSNVQMKAGDVANLGTIGTLAFQPEPEPEPEIPTVLELGKAYADDGVVFWINPDDSKKGKIISGAVANIAWGTTSKYTWIEDINTDDGVANMQYVLNLEGSNATTYPAVYFCKNLGEGWYLPTINEMLDLVRVYYGISSTVDDATLTNNYTADPSNDSAVKFDAELAKCLADDPANAKIAISSTSAWYWTGQGFIKEGDTNTGKNARVKVASTIFLSGGGATNKAYVRCVRDVEIK